MVIDGTRAAARVDRRGAVLFQALIALFAVGALSMGMCQLAAVVARRLGCSLDEKKAFYLAEAGLAEAYVGLAQGKTGVVGSPEMPASFGEGLFWVTAEAASDEYMNLVSTGMCGSGRVRLTAQVTRPAFNYASLGFFSSKQLVIREGSVVDGYDSGILLAGLLDLLHIDLGAILGGLGGLLGGGGLGGLGQPILDLGTILDPKAPKGRLTSNEDIVVMGGSRGVTTRIDGSVEPGIAKRVITSGHVTLNGRTDSLDEVIAPPVVEFPDIVATLRITQSSAVPFVIPSGDHGYAGLTIAPAREVVLIGPATVVVGDLQIGQGARLRFDTRGGPVTLYISGGLALGSKADISSTNDDPTSVRILVGSPPGGAPAAPLVSFGTESSALGYLYAPRSQVTLGDGVAFTGAITALNLVLGKKLHLLSDASLADERNRMPRLVSWEVRETGAAVAPTQQDPFDLLGLIQALLPLPKDAHLDVWLEIGYWPGPGLARVQWSGTYRTFDWDQVYELYHYKIFSSSGGLELAHIHP